MHGIRFCLIALAPILMLTATGCGTFRSTKPAVAGKDTEYGLDRQQQVFAEALANFGTGILLEGLVDPAAPTNYLRAAQLEPKRHQLYARAAAIYLRRDEKDRAIAILEEACRRTPDEPDLYLWLAQIYQSSKDYRKAQRACERAIRLAPTNHQYYIQLAAFYLEQKQDAEALNLLNKALTRVEDKRTLLRFMGDLYAQRINPGNHQASKVDIQKAISFYEQTLQQSTDDLSLTYLHRLGDLYILNGQIPKAITCYQTVMQRQPADAQVKKKLALAYMSLGQKEKAVDVLKSVAGQEPRNTEIQYYLGELYETMGDRTNAAACYTSACNVVPANPMPYLKLAMMTMEDDPDQSIRTLDAGLKRLPEDIKLLELMGHLLLRTNQPAKALETFQRLEDIMEKADPSQLTAGFYLSYGSAAQQCNQMEKAALLFETAVETDPSMMEPYVRLAFLLIAQKKKDAAYQTLQEMMALYPDDPLAYYYLALLHNRAERFQDAIKAFQRSEELNRNNPERPMDMDSAYFFNYGAALERGGQIEQAEQMLDKAVRLDPENSDAFNYLAYMWADKGIRLDQALDYISIALDIEPDNGAYLDTLGWIYFRQKRFEEAWDEIQNALVFMPDDPTVAEHAGDILDALNKPSEALEWWKKSFLRDPTVKTVEDKLKKRGVDTDSLRRQAESIKAVKPAESTRP